MIEIKENKNQLHNICELYQLIPKDKLTRIFKTSQTVGAECDYTFLGFEEVYKAVTLFVPKSKVIIDLGCGYAFQAWYFRNYRKYIAIDNFDSEPLNILKILEIPRFDFYYISIQRFINEIFPKLGTALMKSLRYAHTCQTRAQGKWSGNSFRIVWFIIRRVR